MSTYEDFIYLLKINNNIFGSRQLSKKEKLKIDIFHFDSCFQSSALSIDKSFTETRQYISLQIIFNPIQVESCQSIMVTFFAINTLSLIGENIDNKYNNRQ